MTKPNCWLFDGRPFDVSDIDKYEGFVYLIVNTITGQKYIGRKYFFEIKKIRKKRKRQRTPSNWADYFGSSKQLLADIDKYGIVNFERHILSLHKTRGDCNYQETKLQFALDVLERPLFYNENINGKWHRKPGHIIEGRCMSTKLKDLLCESISDLSTKKASTIL